MRTRWLAGVVAMLAVGAPTLAVGAPALARSRPLISARISPALAGAPGQISLDTSFDSAVDGELTGYEIDLARGFVFQPLGVKGVCSGRALGRDGCPASSRIGAGAGRIAVQGRYLPRTEYAVGLSFFLTPPRGRGDLAGVLLDLDQPQSSLNIALLGSVVPLSRGPYGLALRFSDTARELPSGFDLTLARLQAHLGSGALRAGVTYSLLTNPRSCPRGGWPLAIMIDSAHTSLSYQTSTPCAPRPA